MTDEEMADVYVHNHIHYEVAKREDGTEYAKKVSSVTIKEAFLAGLEAGRLQWHNLQKNPNDLPKKDERFLANVSISVMIQSNKFACYKFACYNFDETRWYSNGLMINPPIAWCEIPRFERKTNGNTED